MIKNLKILIVEDMPSMQNLLQQIFEKTSRMKVTRIVKNSTEARLELTRRRPDLVLLDEVLPGESSFDLLQDLYSEQLPVILMTAIENDQHHLPSQALGRVQKPSWKSDEKFLAQEALQFEERLMGLFQNSPWSGLKNKS